MRKFVIVNANDKRDGFYKTADGKGFESVYPFWLAGDYIIHSAGDTHRDITRAKLYNDKQAAQRQADKLSKRFSVGGEHFVGNRNHSGFRYPDSVGETGYREIAPEYEVREVKVSITLV